MPAIDATAIAVMLILGISAFVRSAVGFGDGLVAMGLLTGWVSLQTATPLVALIGTVISFVILAVQWRQLRLQTALPLIVASLLGIPFGLVLLRLAPEPIARAVLGLLLIVYGAQGLLGVKLPLVRSDRFAGVFGFVAGILGGAYNTHGSVVAIYGTLKRWQPDKFLLTLQAYFLFINFLILAGHGIAGLWTAEVWRLFLVSLPAVGVSIGLGAIAHQRINSERFAKLVFGVLLLVGLLSLRQSLR